MYVLKNNHINLAIGLLFFLATTKVYGNWEVISHVPPVKSQLIGSLDLEAKDLFYAGNYLMVECQLNGKSAYFMIDTGASYTVLNSKSSKWYDFQVIDRNLATTGFGAKRCNRGVGRLSKFRHLT